MGRAKDFSPADPLRELVASDEVTVVFEDTPDTPDHPPDDLVDWVPLEENVVDDEFRRC